MQKTLLKSRTVSSRAKQDLQELEEMLKQVVYSYKINRQIVTTDCILADKFLPVRYI